MKLKEILLLGAILSPVSCVSCSHTPNPILKSFNEVHNLEYKSEEPGEDYWQTPKETERLGKGDCEDFAYYLQDKLKKRGIKSEVKFGYGSLMDNSSGHAWVEYNLGKDTYVLDPTNGTIFRRDSISPFLYFKLPERVFKKKMDEYKERLSNEK